MRFQIITGLIIVTVILLVGYVQAKNLPSHGISNMICKDNKEIDATQKSSKGSLWHTTIEATSLQEEKGLHSPIKEKKSSSIKSSESKAFHVFVHRKPMKDAPITHITEVNLESSIPKEDMVKKIIATFGTKQANILTKLAVDISKKHRLEEKKSRKSYNRIARASCNTSKRSSRRVSRTSKRSHKTEAEGKIITSLGKKQNSVPLDDKDLMKHEKNLAKKNLDNPEEEMKTSTPSSVFAGGLKITPATWKFKTKPLPQELREDVDDKGNGKATKEQATDLKKDSSEEEEVSQKDFEVTSTTSKPTQTKSSENTTSNSQKRGSNQREDDAKEAVSLKEESSIISKGSIKREDDAIEALPIKEESSTRTKGTNQTEDDVHENPAAEENSSKTPSQLSSVTHDETPKQEDLATPALATTPFPQKPTSKIVAVTPKSNNELSELRTKGEASKIANAMPLPITAEEITSVSRGRGEDIEELMETDHGTSKDSKTNSPRDQTKSAILNSNNEEAPSSRTEVTPRLNTATLTTLDSEHIPKIETFLTTPLPVTTPLKSILKEKDMVESDLEQNFMEDLEEKKFTSKVEHATIKSEKPKTKSPSSKIHTVRLDGLDTKSNMDTDITTTTPKLQTSKHHRLSLNDSDSDTPKSEDSSAIVEVSTFLTEDAALRAATEDLDFRLFLNDHPIPTNIDAFPNKSENHATFSTMASHEEEVLREVGHSFT
ncbi:uncharacterized protein LOC142230040 [Haematobia irritans]|uniref:uncharacterized protein LOC142230040 n=1 Tax=Haematobia irritans TaxID=7368 RepID=UPI003F4F5581